MVPLYMNATLLLRNKLHKLLMTAARTAIGNYCPSKSITYILQKCNWECIDDRISHASITSIHKIICTNNVPSLRDKYRISGNKRACTKLALKYTPKTEKFKKFFINKALTLYNDVPNEVKALKCKNFKIKLKEHIREQTHDSYD